jgi:hypothetical protein
VVKVFLLQRVLASVPGEEEGEPQEDAEDEDAHLEGKRDPQKILLQILANRNKRLRFKIRKY